ncbi:MAG: hypothetical protein JXR97_04675 [Planctomycetes bacterium]|nr:hypothetical protein [Planctomycetota bacterium]
MGVTAIYPEGEYPEVIAQACQMPKPLECRKFGDMVGINHFWDGGGNRQEEDRNADAYKTVALDLLQQCGIKHIRWWVVDKGIYEKYYAKGIGVYTYTHGRNMEEGNKLGVWAFAGAGNEPDLSTTPIETYLGRLQKVYAKKQEICPEAVICAPSSGLEDSSIEWLDKFYQLGGKDSFDVLDLHTYCKIAGGHKEPEGYPKGAPEAMYDNMRKIREIVKKHGDENKPVISTEFGYSEAIPNNPSGKVTPLIKTQYLVRGLIIHNVLGFKRVFLYSFWDEGRDQNFTEHTFGLIDYDLQKKPAYYAVQNLIATMGDCTLAGEIAGLEQPSFGYHYRDNDKEKNVYVIWDGTGGRKATFKASDQKVTRIDMMGTAGTLVPEKDGSFTVVYGPSPVYLVTKSAIEYVSSERVNNPSDAGAVELLPLKTQVMVAGDATNAAFAIDAKNASKNDLDARIIILDGNDKSVFDQKYEIKSGMNEHLDISMPLAQNELALQKYTLQIIQSKESGTFAEEYALFVRKLPPVGDGVTISKAMFSGLSEPVYCLSNDKVVVSIDASRGARVLEIIDRKTLSNQIRLDYSLVADLPSIPYAYGIWSTMNGKFKNSPMNVVAAADGVLELSAEADELELVQSWSLKGGSLSLATRINNKGQGEKKVVYKIHPEYTVGGTGDSVTDIIYLPKGERVEKVPFWSGLGEKPCGQLSQNWWAAFDSGASIAIKQTLALQDWAEPRIWFGQGHYNVELQTRRELVISAGQAWSTGLVWDLIEKASEETISAPSLDKAEGNTDE